MEPLRFAVLPVAKANKGGHYMSDKSDSNRKNGLGFWTILVGGGFLIFTLPLQLLINYSVSIDTATSMVIGTVIWLVWLVWVIAAIVLATVWLVRRLRKSGRDPGEK